jgi:ATP-dependent protease ClpP protease subunit
MYCSNCGDKVLDTDNFCGSCGTSILRVASNNAAKEAVIADYELEPDPKSTIEDPAPPAQSLRNIKVDNLSEDKIKPIYRSETSEPPPTNTERYSLKTQDKPNWFIRHWRGELSLVRSYWLNTFCVNLIIYIAFFIMEKAKFVEEYPYQSFFLIFATFGIACWQLVGLWRSATKYLDNGRSSLWGNLARLTVILGCLQNCTVLVDVSKELAILNDFYANIALSKEADYETEFRFINNNKELLVTGGIGSKSVNEFTKIASANPNLSLIHLNNDGGRISEAYEIYKFIKARGYNTYTSGQCLSACTIMFLGGKQRLISITGKLGFHSASIGNLDGQDYENINDEFKNIYQEAGVSESLISRALSTPANEIYYPDHQELLSSNAVDLIVEPSNFGSTSLLTLLEENKLEKAFLEYKTFTAMKKHYPHLYTPFIKRVIELTLDGRPINDYKAYSTNFFNSNLPEVVKYASPEAIEKYVFAQHKMFSIFISETPQSCNYYLYPDKIPVPSYTLTKDDAAEIDDAFYDLITSKGARVDVDITIYQQRIDEAASTVFENNPSIVSAFEDEVADINDKGGCVYLLGLYEELWNNSGENPAEVFRYLYSS